MEIVVKGYDGTRFDLVAFTKGTKALCPCGARPKLEDLKEVGGTSRGFCCPECDKPLMWL